MGLPSSVANKNIDGNVTLLEIAASNEFGVPEKGIPARSFIRAPINLFEEKIYKSMDKHLNVSKIDTNKALGVLGATATSVILEAFKTRGFGKWKENSDLTKLLKGSDSPLVDTGQLRQSITWEIR